MLDLYADLMVSVMLDNDYQKFESPTKFKRGREPFIELLRTSLAVGRLPILNDVMLERSRIGSFYIVLGTKNN